MLCGPLRPPLPATAPLRNVHTSDRAPFNQAPERAKPQGRESAMAEDKQGERVEIDCPECGSKAYYGNGGIACTNPDCKHYGA